MQQKRLHREPLGSDEAIHDNSNSVFLGQKTPAFSLFGLPPELWRGALSIPKRAWGQWKNGAYRDLV